MKKMMKWIIGFWKKHEEGMNYLFWGGVAFVLSMVLFIVFTTTRLPLQWNEVFANTVDWIICVVFTFLTNKFFVFKSKAGSLKAFGVEFAEFILARLFTLLLEDVIIWILCNRMGWSTGLLQTTAKLIGQFVVIVTNYILSKWWIFKGKETPKKSLAASPEKEPQKEEV